MDLISVIGFVLVRVVSWFQLTAENYSRHNLVPKQLALLVTPLFLFQLATLGQVSKPADLVVINANVRTIVSESSRAEAFAVSGNRFVAVGTTKQIRKWIGQSTRVIDARGRLVLPGFNDAHVHFMGIGNSFSTLDLRNVTAASDMAERVSRYVRFLPKGRWILGGGWDDSKWQPPDRKSIDAISPDNPVFLYHSDGKAAFANTAAFKLAGLKSEDGVSIVRGDALKKIAAAVPKSHTSNWLEIAETATNYAASLGVTSVQDMHSDDGREIYRELRRLGKLKTRIYDCVALSDWSKLARVNQREPNTDMTRSGCLKSFSDGDAESTPRLLREVTVADKAGLQIMVHAIGNSANEIVLTVFEQVARANGTRDRRLRVEHAHNPRLGDIPRFGRGFIASMQPHLFAGGTGEYYSSLTRSGARIAFGSDASITDFNPLLGIHAAVNASPEALSVYDAVKAYTAGSAYAEFQEKAKGTIEPGKLADFVILSEDIFVVHRSKISSAAVMTTVVNGVMVFESLSPHSN